MPKTCGGAQEGEKSRIFNFLSVYQTVVWVFYLLNTYECSTVMSLEYAINKKQQRLVRHFSLLLAIYYYIFHTFIFQTNNPIFSYIFHVSDLTKAFLSSVTCQSKYNNYYIVIENKRKLKL